MLSSVAFLRPQSQPVLFLLSMRGSQLAALPDWAPPQWLKEEVSPWALPPSLAHSQSATTREGVSWGEWVFAGWDFFYLRKYQASSAMMSSSSDRTNTVGRMWWLWDPPYEKEEAELGVREQHQQNSRKMGKGYRYICAYFCGHKSLVVFTFLSHVCITWTDKTKSISDPAMHLPCSLLAPSLI